MKTAVIYGSTTDNTKNVAKQIAEALGAEATVIDVAKLKVADLVLYSNLVLGTSTWDSGDLQDDWDDFLSQLQAADLSGKVVALFGLGDASSYPDTFVDGMGTIYEAIQDKSCKIIGAVPVEGYSFDDSKAAKDGFFVGLPLDDDNESNLTPLRINDWIRNISPDFL